MFINNNDIKYNSETLYIHFVVLSYYIKLVCNPYSTSQLKYYICNRNTF